LQKRYIENKKCTPFSSTVLLVQNIFVPNTLQVTFKMCTKMHIYFHIKRLLLLSDTNQKCNVLTNVCKPATGLWNIEAHFLDHWLTYGSEVVSLMCRWPFTPQEYSWYSFLLEAESTPRVIVRLEGLDQLKNPMTSSGYEPKTFQLVT
jgi:hypothetical protein